MKLTKKQIKIIEDNTAFSVEDVGDGYEISWYTDAGEDYSFYVTKDESINEIIDYVENFDPEEHAAMWFGGPGAPGLRALLDDADKIQENLFELKEVILNENHY